MTLIFSASNPDMSSKNTSYPIPPPSRRQTFFFFLLVAIGCPQAADSSLQSSSSRSSSFSRTQLLLHRPRSALNLYSSCNSDLRFSNLSLSSIFRFSFLKTFLFHTARL